MDREILCELFLQNKAKAHTNQKKCVGFLSENGEFRYRIVLQEKPANAVLYLCVRQSRNTEKLLEYEKQRLFRYCDTQGYQPIVLLESIGGEPFLGKHAQGRIMELAELRYVDVVVLSHVNSLFQFLDHTSGILEKIYRCGVKVDCVGCGVLEFGVLESYRRKSWCQERAFRVRLMGLVIERKRWGER